MLDFYRREIETARLFGRQTRAYKDAAKRDRQYHARRIRLARRLIRVHLGTAANDPLTQLLRELPPCTS